MLSHCLVFFSLRDQVSMNNFAELSGCVFAWIEEQCKPGDLQELMAAILRQVPVPVYGVRFRVCSVLKNFFPLCVLTCMC
jgi:hypothetical protein